MHLSLFDLPLFAYFGGFGRGGGVSGRYPPDFMQEWHDWLFLLLSVIVVYSDGVLNWIGENTDRTFTKKHAWLLSSVALGCTFVAINCLQWRYTRVGLAEPIFFISALTVIRGIYWLLDKFANL